MRKIALLFAVALLAPAARAANVEILRPHVMFLTSEEVSAACKLPNESGCTIMKTEFQCACARSGDKWAPSPRFITTPYVYTTNMSIMHHELSHIADVRDSLSEYAATLTLRVFESEAACLSFGADEKKVFTSTMQNIQRITTLRRDGARYAESAGDH